jgi:hypothetical protein
LRPRISGTADDTFDASRRIPDAIRDGCFLIGGGTGGGGSPSPRPPVPPSAYPADDAISGRPANRLSSPTQPMVVRARLLTAAWPRAPFHTQRLVGCKFGNGKGRKGKGNVVHAAVDARANYSRSRPGRFWTKIFWKKSK